MTPKTSILLLTGEFPPFAGGVATYCDRLATLLTELNEPVAVLAPRTSRSVDAEDRRRPFPVQRFRNPPTVAARSIFRLAALLAAVIRYQPRMLWAADWRLGVLVAPIARFMKLPFAVSVYGSEVLMAKRSPGRRLLALSVFRQAQVVLSISRYTRGIAADFGVPPERLAVVPLGVDPEAANVSDEAVEGVRRRHGLAGYRVILTLGRLTPRKGHDTVLQALPTVLRQVPDTVYVIAGTGDDRQRLEDLAHRLEVTDRVVFAGQVAEEEKAAYYKACDLFIMLSRQDEFYVEGFGLAFLEAGACERPVVGGHHGGVPEAVLHGKTGLLVDPESPQQASEAIVRLLQDRKLAQSFGRAARRRIQQDATWGHVARLTLKHLRPYLHPERQ